jgi:hypothetical protein
MQQRLGFLPHHRHALACSRTSCTALRPSEPTIVSPLDRQSRAFGRAFNFRLSTTRQLSLFLFLLLSKNTCSPCRACLSHLLALRLPIRAPPLPAPARRAAPTPLQATARLLHLSTIHYQRAGQRICTKSPPSIPIRLPQRCSPRRNRWTRSAPTATWRLPKRWNG